jgi:L-rhamnonate dehydratase
VARIEAVRAWMRPGAAPAPAWLADAPLTSALSEYGYATLADWPDRSRGEVAVEVVCEDGASGVGVALGGHATGLLVEEALAPVLVGRDAADVEGLWRLGSRVAVQHGTNGHALAAVSGVDLALWDLAGKRADLPVYALATPEASPRVPCYATGPEASLYEGGGYVGVKVCPPRGPDGVEESADFLREQRAALDRAVFLAVDCYMGLTPESALELHRRTADLGLAWLEEPLLAWQLDELAALRRAGVPVTSGEHNGPAELDRLIALDAVEILQPELTWSGGFTDALRLAARAPRLVPHAGGVFACHLAAALGDMAEFSFYHCADPAVPEPVYAGLLAGDLPVPSGGAFTLSSASGWGCSLASGVVRSTTT